MINNNRRQSKKKKKNRDEKPLISFLIVSAVAHQWSDRAQHAGQGSGQVWLLSPAAEWGEIRVPEGGSYGR